MSKLKEKAENAADLMLDFVREYPWSWAILLAYSAALVVLGAWIF